MSRQSAVWPLLHQWRVRGDYKHRVGPEARCTSHCGQEIFNIAVIKYRKLRAYMQAATKNEQRAQEVRRICGRLCRRRGDLLEDLGKEYAALCFG